MIYTVNFKILMHYSRIKYIDMKSFSPLVRATYGQLTGFSALKTMLKYKCENAGVLFEEVSERFTTQICSCCGEITASSPKGRADLRIRVWECECGSVNQRDLNSAKNILALGHKRLAVGITLLSGG